MFRHSFILIVSIASAAHAQDTVTQQADAGTKQEPPPQPAAVAAGETQPEVKTLSGISILGNQEAPKSLVIVPWKSSQIGDMQGLSRLLDDAVRPVDKEVFMRELDYHLIRSSSQ